MAKSPEGRAAARSALLHQTPAAFYVIDSTGQRLQHAPGDAWPVLVKAFSKAQALRIAKRDYGPRVKVEYVDPSLSRPRGRPRSGAEPHPPRKESLS